MRNVLLMSNEAATVAAVAAAMEYNGQFDAKKDVCGSIEDLARRLEHGDTPVVLVDIDGDPEGTIAAIEPLSRRFGGTRFVVLSAVLQADLLLLAMRSGAHNFLQKRVIAQDLAGILNRIAASRQARQKSGSLVTVLSAGGGCGATTLVVNLANELALQSKDTTTASSLVVDLDCTYGAVASYLGLDGAFGILDLMNRDGPVDAQLIRSTALSRWPGTEALINTAPSRMGQVGALDGRRIAQTLQICRSVYRWTIVDAPRLPLACTSEIVRQSNAVFLLAQLTIKDLRAARQMLDALSRSVPGVGVRVLIGRYHRRRHLITLAQARETLGLSEGQTLGCLNNDYAAISQAVNLGKPLAEVARRSALRRDVQALTDELAQVDQEPEQPGHLAMKLQSA